ncbi:excalibur calcium-binding domain-containing protein [Streptococcus suis]|uniref:Excalibur calcium-binding domain-containing protein n=1 Tax=Streptococcus suis TaxID=1307 RepID=A0A9X4RN20_STRSU|nr:excalibur calcium-binding domain-containing protein [Streptococcus parasuis]MDG4511526.1 excalibur calcium-binding domain-containing protein [Streptococcus suis]WDN57715.1 excalibur calcium-binding domain-containing protein [Streptococcus parasuis]WDN59533.1 excalibur calcium-binding domain-containing protein [Streptococcus parasuis]
MASKAAEVQRILESQAQAQSQIQQFAGTTSGSVSYKNCTEARNAGAAPVRIGDSGYAHIWTVMVTALDVSKIFSK